MPYPATTIETPVGALTLVAGERGLAAILWPEDKGRARFGDLVETPDHPVLDRARRELAAYFAGTLQRFTVPLDAAGTPFQRAVWTALVAIPYGETRSYADIARAIGHPTAFRAVGAANGRNPLPIMAPCHRVVGSAGALTGFAGGIDAKRRLLALEAGGSLPL